MYAEAMQLLEDLARSNPENAKLLGFAKDRLRLCAKHGLSRRCRFYRLPDARAQFGYFTVHECDEGGREVGVVAGPSGGPIEVLHGALIVEMADDVEGAPILGLVGE